jgi:hypothetical protein
MQAPTTSSGGPVHEPGSRTCAGCGAANGAAAAFCWQCYRPFGVPPAGPVPVRPGGGRGATWTPPAPVSVPTPIPEPPHSGNTVGTVARIAVALVAAVVGYLFFANRGPDIQLPQAFGGLDRIQNQQVDTVVEQLREDAEVEGLTADMAMYGTSGLPSAGLIWVQEMSVPDTESAYQEFATGFDAGFGGSGSLGEQTTEVVAGVEYVCAPIVVQPPGNLCLWEADDVFWVLLDVSGTATLGDTRDLSVIAHDTVAAG